MVILAPALEWAFADTVADSGVLGWALSHGRRCLRLSVGWLLIMDRSRASVSSTPVRAGQFACHELLLLALFRLTIATVVGAGRMVTIVPLLPVVVRARFLA